MTAVSIHNTIIIPYQETTFRDVLKDRMRNYCITMDDDLLTIKEGASEQEIEAAFRSLFDTNRQTSVTLRFAIGDLYNAIPKKYGAKKAFVVDRFGEDYYQTIRQYAWVASKWPKGTRDLSKGWSHYVEGAFDRAPKPKDPVPLTFVSQENLPDGATVFHYEGPHGRHYTSRIEAAMKAVQPAGEPFTYRQRAVGYGADVLHEGPAAEEEDGGGVRRSRSVP